MAIILVTGMSGTGKSTTLGFLAERGYRVVDTDYDGWILSGAEPLWDEPRIDALLTSHEHSGVPLFIAGTVVNQQNFYSRFDEIVLLSAPLDTMLARTAARSTNPFGKSAADRAQITSDLAEIEPLLREAATVEIDTRQPVAEVVVALIALTPPPATP